MATEELECCEDCQIHPDRLDIVNSGMPEEEELYDLAELFKVFGDSTRIRILFVLFEAEVCVCDLADSICFNVSSTTPTIMMMDVPPKDTEAPKAPLNTIGIVQTIRSPIAPIKIM